MTSPTTGRLARLEARIRPAAWQADLAIALVVGVIAAVVPRYGFGTERVATLLFVVLPLALRSRVPLVVLTVVALGTVGTRAAGGLGDVVAVAIASFSVGELVEDRLLSPVWMLAVAAGMAAVLSTEGGDALLSIALPFIVIVPSWVVGDTIRNRRVDAAARRDEAARGQREREAALESAIADERRHMARELHDVVAHGVSLMLIQTGAARQVLRRAPDQAEEALLAAEATGREAMDELRRLLGLLNDEGEAASLVPQPGLGQLDGLVARVREAGLPARLEVAGERRPLPPGLEVTAYRIAQEALTNALRHAGPAPTLVRIVFEPDELRIEVLDEGPAKPARVGGASKPADGAAVTGRGLVGMRERAAGLGGRFEAGPRVGGGYAVRAWLPIDAVAR